MPRFRLEKYLARVRALPVTIGHVERIMTDSIPAAEELTGALKLIATHIHVPLMGNAYSISIYDEGPEAPSERRVMRAALIRALGEPIVETENPDGCLLFFKSDDQRMPRTYVHKVLGDERLAQHCTALSRGERAIIDEALAAMEAHLRDIPRKRQAIMAIMAKLPRDRIPVVSNVLMAIVRDFAQSSPQNN